MDAEVLTIGDELTRGEIVDTNSTWLAERLSDLGFHVRWKTSTTDDAADIDEALGRASQRAGVLVCSGGLGPTDDDRTVDRVAQLLGVDAVLDAAHEAKMRARFDERGFRLTENNLRQVRVPRGAEVLENRNGMAPGFEVRLGQALCVFMPGVPREMKGIFDDHASARLAARLGAAGVVTRRRVFRVMGLGESHVDAAMKGFIDGVASASLHYRIAYPEVFVTVVVRRQTAREADELIEVLTARAKERIGANLYGLDADTLPIVVGQRLIARGETLATAESCTGGMLGEWITAVPGSSRYFLGGVVSYADAAKQRLLAVSKETLAQHGAVSAQTVLEMAQGARRALEATWVLAISGIAGPDGGTADKPVGTIELAIVGPGVAQTRRLQGFAGRELNRQLASASALHLLLKQL